MDSARLVADGRELRVDPNNATVDDFPDMRKMKPAKAEKKIEEIRRGAETRAAHEVLPHDREWQDLIFLALFVVAVVGTLGYGYACSGALIERIKEGIKQHNSTDFGSVAQGSDDDVVRWPTAQVLGLLAGTASLVSLIAAMLFVLLAHRAPACVVWSSLVFGPAFTMLMGAGLIATQQTVGMIMGGIFILMGLLSLTCVFCCWRRLVPFMIKVTEVVADVIEHHPCMLAVGVIGTFLGVCWTAAASIAFASIYAQHEQSIDMEDKHVRYVVVFVCALLFSWGGGVASNICHVTYCGVFGRWYYGGGGQSSGSEAEENTLGPSFAVAVTTSLGSICFGSLLVALVRAAEAVTRQMESDAKQEGNAVLLVVACILTCFIRCLGDILEYFNDWAYVQCAIRGVSFMDAARITYSMMTCANVKYILSDLLLNSVVSMGAMVVALSSAISAAAVGYGVDGSAPAVGSGLVIGFVIGIISGHAALGIINSGVKTLLACWADDPRPLMDSHPDIHEEFSSRLQQNYDTALAKM